MRIVPIGLRVVFLAEPIGLVGRLRSDVDRPAGFEELLGRQHLEALDAVAIGVRALDVERIVVAFVVREVAQELRLRFRAAHVGGIAGERRLVVERHLFGQVQREYQLRVVEHAVARKARVDGQAVHHGGGEPGRAVVFPRALRLAGLPAVGIERFALDGAGARGGRRGRRRIGAGGVVGRPVGGIDLHFVGSHERGVRSAQLERRVGAGIRAHLGRAGCRKPERF